MRGIGRLQRYLARRFLLAILAVFALCFVLIFMIDMVELLRESGKFGGASLLRLATLSVLRAPAYAELTLPFSVLTGSIGACLLLARSSELTVMRAAGMSAWQVLLPGVIVAALVGTFANLVYSSLAASARSEAEALFAETFGREQNLLKTKTAGLWLRQDSVDGSSVISAAASSNQGMSLTGASVTQFDPAGKFVEQIDARQAELKDGYWELTHAWVSRPGAERSALFAHYQVPTHLSRAQVTDALGSVYSLSYWDLPKAIELAEKAGLSATRYKVQYEILQSRPLLLAVMVLLGATVSLRTFRMGGVQAKVIIGLVTGFGFFILAEVSRQMGVSGIATPKIAAWAPVLIACFLSLTVLLHQEDG
jgi:lipopolysaccharide export system permease protein